MLRFWGTGGTGASLPLKAAAVRMCPYLKNPTKNNRVKAPLFTIGVDTGKRRFVPAVEGEDGAELLPLPQGSGRIRLQLLPRVDSGKDGGALPQGRAVIAWELKGDYKRNEPLDLRNYARRRWKLQTPCWKAARWRVKRRHRAQAGR